jgi:hypothetical protein
MLLVNLIGAPTGIGRVAALILAFGVPPPPARTAPGLAATTLITPDPAPHGAQLKGTDAKSHHVTDQTAVETNNRRSALRELTQYSAEHAR